VKRIVEWIREKPISGFFFITFVITWGLGFSFIAVLQRGMYQLSLLLSIALCGPALAGILVIFIGNREPKSGSKKAQWVAFLIASLAGTAIYSAHNYYFINVPILVGNVVLAMLLVTPPVALVISTAFSRVAAVRSAMITLVDPRGYIAWSLIALVIFPGLAFLSIAISGWLGRYGTFRSGYAVSGLPLLGLIIVRFLYQFFFYNAVGEEAGWTGFARPRLQAHVSPLITALIVTLFWAPWHAFLWYVKGQDVFSLHYWIDTYFDLMPDAIIYGWLFNRSKGSILVVGIAHAARNTAAKSLPGLDWPRMPRHS
jgi:membrane protease YdiL (CAAX protease family)